MQILNSTVSPFPCIIISSVCSDYTLPCFTLFCFYLQIGADEPSSQGQGTANDDRQTATRLCISDLDSLLTETVPTCIRQLRMVVSRGDTEVSTNCVMQGLDAVLLLLNSDWTDFASGGHNLRLLLEQLGGLVDDLLQRLFEPGEDDMIQVLCL